MRIKIKYQSKTSNSSLETLLTSAKKNHQSMIIANNSIKKQVQQISIFYNKVLLVGEISILQKFGTL